MHIGGVSKCRVTFLVKMCLRIRVYYLTYICRIKCTWQCNISNIFKYLDLKKCQLHDKYATHSIFDQIILKLKSTTLVKIVEMCIECVSKCRIIFLVKMYSFIRVYSLSFVYEDGMITSRNIFKTFQILRIVTQLHDKYVTYSILQPK